MKQYIQNGYLITEYDNGATVKVLQSDEPKEVIPELPKNPIIELQSKVDSLGQELAKAKVENVKKDNIINTLGKEIAQLKIQVSGGNK